MNRIGHLVAFAKFANGAMIAIETRVLEQPADARDGFSFWCYRTQFARIVEKGIDAARSPEASQ